MASRAESTVVYAAGAAQGIVLVTFPAASTIFTSPHEYNLSDAQYGVLFLPQVATAISASLLGAWLGRRYGPKRLYLVGLGAGFGLSVPALNTLTAEFHPTTIDSSVLTLNALLGVGTALAPVFVAIFVGLGFWWGLPVMSALVLVALLAVSVRLPLRVQGGASLLQPA